MKGAPNNFKQKGTKRTKNFSSCLRCYNSPGRLVIFVCFCSIFSPLLWCSSALAHEVRPAYLELRQTGAETYDVLWKVPARGGDMRLSLHIEFPSDTIGLTTPRTSFANEASTERWTVKRPNGFSGGVIHIAGLAATMTDVLVRVEGLDGTSQVTRLTPSSPSFVVKAAPGALEVTRTYLLLGIEHIGFGIDHLLFVLALLIITNGTVRLFKTVTAFTLAHSITLALATLGFVHVPSKPVEATIALSIVFVAFEIIRRREGQNGITSRAPWIVAFTFGLLHGFGFAGALGAIGLPQNHIPTALLFFNVGVEIGQLAFITVVLGLIALVRRIPLRVPQWAELIPPYAIGSVAMFWVVQRVAAF
jgi:HupE / UreJ protein